MNKSQFLEALGGYITILEDAEQEDILGEYAQHIDMKVAAGMTEEEAVADFGPVDEFAAEILGAYHVKAGIPVEEAEAAPADREDVAAAFGTIGRASKQAAGGFLDRAKAFMSRNERRKSPEALEAKAQRREARAQRRAGVGKAVGSAAGTTGRGIKRFFFMAWVVIVALCALCVALCALSALFGFGVSFVWMVQGYPLIGVTLCALGGIAVLGMPVFAMARWVVEAARKLPKVPVMRKASKIALGIFCGGVLVAGIGTGVAFAEFTSLEYAGTHVIGEENVTEHTMTLHVDEPDCTIYLDDLAAFPMEDVAVDASLPADTIQVTASYNDEITSVYLWDYNGNVCQEGSSSYRVDPADVGADVRDVVLSLEVFNLDEWGTFMTNKDQILADLKKGILSDYTTVSVQNVQVSVSPTLWNRVMV